MTVLILHSYCENNLLDLSYLTCYLLDVANPMKESLKFISSLIFVVFVISGIAGISYDLFRPEGWLSRWMGNIWSMEMSFIIMGIPVLIITLALAKMWLGGLLASSKGDTMVNVLMGALVLAGVYYFFKFAL